MLLAGSNAIPASPPASSAAPGATAARPARAATGATSSVASGITLTTAPARSGERRQTSISCTTARKSKPTSAAETSPSARLASRGRGPRSETGAPRRPTSATTPSAATGACA